MKLDPKDGNIKYDVAVRDYFGAMWFLTLLLTPFCEANTSQYPAFVRD